MGQWSGHMKFTPAFWDFICCGKHPQNAGAVGCTTQEEDGTRKLLNSIATGQIKVLHVLTLHLQCLETIAH